MGVKCVGRRDGGEGRCVADGLRKPHESTCCVARASRPSCALVAVNAGACACRRKWFQEPALAALPPGPQPLAVRDGELLGSLAAATMPAAASASGRQRQPSGPAARSAAPLHFTIPTSALPTGRAKAAGPAATGAPSTTRAEQQQQPAAGTASAHAAAADVVSPETLAAVLAGRRRFLNHQRQLDGVLVSAAEPRLNPLEVVEDVVEGLMDELLMEHAAGAVGACVLARVRAWPREAEGLELRATGWGGRHEGHYHLGSRSCCRGTMRACCTSATGRSGLCRFQAGKAPRSQHL